MQFASQATVWLRWTVDHWIWYSRNCWSTNCTSQFWFWAKKGESSCSLWFDYILRLDAVRSMRSGAYKLLIVLFSHTRRHSRSSIRRQILRCRHSNPRQRWRSSRSGLLHQTGDLQGTSCVLPEVRRWGIQKRDQEHPSAVRPNPAGRRSEKNGTEEVRRSWCACQIPEILPLIEIGSVHIYSN